MLKRRETGREKLRRKEQGGTVESLHLLKFGDPLLQSLEVALFALPRLLRRCAVLLPPAARYASQQAAATGPNSNL